MGSGLSAIYDIKSSYGEMVVSEMTDEYASNRDSRLKDYFSRMLSRKTDEEATYSRNVVDTAFHYEMNDNGLFGKRGEGRYVRIIESEDPMGSAMDFFEKISNGAKTETMNNESALYCHLNDGVRINFRPYSSSPGSPAVDIHIVQMDKIQKIHFVLRELL